MGRIALSKIGLGLAALGRPGYINLGHAADLAQEYDVNSMAQQAHAVLDAAWAGGVRYFDAARSYGRAEAFLASWLDARQIAPEQVAVGSKWGYTYTANWQVQAAKHEVKEHSLAVLQRQWAESRQLLTRHLRLYQIHSATLDSGVLENRAVHSELARLKETGVKIGLSLSGANQAQVLERAMQIEVDGVRLFDSVQATWNLLEPSAGAMLAQAHHAGLTVIIKEALANGRLTLRNTSPQFAANLAVLQAQAKRLHTTVDALALAAAVAQPWADVVLSGAATVEQIESNLGALDVKWDAKAVNALAELAEAPDSYWETRGALVWN
ncbi:MAG: aldo/keto reductase [Caldilineaceae bacterium]